MASRSHLSIGEVLSLLREEFPDITISKIRFLESQGLVDPERTPSGYRKFYESDVERLRWILVQQREHFLPLKVIKGRLADGMSEGSEDQQLEGMEDGMSAEPFGSAGDQQMLLPVGTEMHRSTRSGRQRSLSHRPSRRDVQPSAEPSYEHPEVLSEHPEVETASAPHLPSPPADSPLSTAPVQVPSKGSGTDRFPRRVSLPDPPKLTSDQPDVSVASVEAKVHASSGSEDSLTLSELCGAVGIEPSAVAELERFGLIAPNSVGGTAYYDADAVAVVRAAHGFAKHGVEARHLRAYRSASEREAGLIEQVVLPLLRQRNPKARHAASEAVSDLSRLGADLRGALLRGALRDLR